MKRLIESARSLVRAVGLILITLLLAAAAIADSPQLVMDELFAGFQVIEVKAGVGKAYLDVLAHRKPEEREVYARGAVEKIAKEGDGFIGFYTDKPMQTLNIEIIQITNVNEYNVGSGYVKLGNAVLEHKNEAWTVAQFQWRGAAGSSK